MELSELHMSNSKKKCKISVMRPHQVKKLEMLLNLENPWTLHLLLI